MQVQETKLAWLAGIIDGEGCLQIWWKTRTHRSGNSTCTPSARITITNSSEAIVQECIKIFQDLGIKYYCRDPKNSVIRKMVRLEILNYGSLKTILDAVTPYMIGKKDQAEALREFVEKASKRNGFSSQEEKEEYLLKVRAMKKADLLTL